MMKSPKMNITIGNIITQKRGNNYVSICSRNKKDNDNHLTAEIIEEITQEELDDLNSAFTFAEYIIALIK